MRRCRYLLLPVAVAICGCAAVFDQGDALAIAPYHVEDTGRVVVEVRLNDRGPYHFAMDTAASISALFEGTRRGLGIDYAPNQWAIIHGGVTTRRYPLIRVASIALGREDWENARVVSMPGDTAAGASIDGILGVDFLRRYAVGLFSRRQAVQLYSPALVDHDSLRGWTSVRLDPRPVGGSGAALYFFEVEINGRPIPALFDLGAGVNILNRAAAQSLELTPAELPERNRVFSDAHADLPVVARYVADDVTMGGVRWRNEPFSVVDLPLFETVLPDGRPAAILGAGMFTDRNFVIDFNRSRILVRNAAEPRAD